MQAVFINGGVLRRLYSSDLPQFEAHLLRLDAPSRRDRFSMAVADAYLSRYAARGFAPGDVAYGFFVDDILRGAGELRQNEPARLLRKGSAEAAFSVEPPWRRRGVGEALMARIVRAAQNRRDGTLTMLCLAENTAMRRLARKFSAEITFETDQVTGRLVGRPASPLSLWGEMMDDAAGLAGSALHWGVRAAPKGA